MNNAINFNYPLTRAIHKLKTIKLHLYFRPTIQYPSLNAISLWRHHTYTFYSKVNTHLLSTSMNYETFLQITSKYGMFTSTNVQV